MPTSIGTAKQLEMIQQVQCPAGNCTVSVMVRLEPFSYMIAGMTCPSEGPVCNGDRPCMALMGDRFGSRLDSV